MVTTIDSCFGVENAHFEFLPHTYLKVKNFLVISKLKHSKPNVSKVFYLIAGTQSSCHPIKPS